jgi:hypothetical protein
MRLLKILALTTLVALVVAGVASAKVRDGMATVAETAEDVLVAVTDPSPSATPSASPSASPSADPSVEPSAEPSVDASEEALPEYDGHGAAVSAVARDKAAVATWVNPAGKEITNHGKAVSAVARSDAGKGGDAEAASGQSKKDK